MEALVAMADLQAELAEAEAVAVDMTAAAAAEAAVAVATRYFQDRRVTPAQVEPAQQAPQAPQAKHLPAQQTSPPTQAGRCPS